MNFIFGNHALMSLGRASITSSKARVNRLLSSTIHSIATQASPLLAPASMDNDKVRIISKQVIAVLILRTQLRHSVPSEHLSTVSCRKARSMSRLRTWISSD